MVVGDFDADLVRDFDLDALAMVDRTDVVAPVPTRTTATTTEDANCQNGDNGGTDGDVLDIMTVSF